jgi:IS4 transposase
MAFDSGRCLRDRFANVRQRIGWLFPKTRRVGKTYQGFVEALRRHSGVLLERVTAHLRSQVQATAGRHWRVEGFCVFAVDGSQIDCPRTQANLADMGRRGKDPLRPSLWLTMLWHVGTGLPWAWRIDKATASEHTHLRQMLRLLPPQALLLMDAGFVSYELLREILGAGHSFLVRVGSNRQLLRGLGCAVRETATTVHLWPQDHREGPPLELRLICRSSGEGKVFLLTNLPKEQLSKKQAGRLYRARWGIEVYYRTLKQTLERRKMLSGSPDLAQLELAWTLAGLWLSGLLGVEALIQDGQSPTRLSMATALRVLPEAVAGQLRRRIDRALAQAVKDEYPRSQPKASRNWADKKHDSPPQAPKMRNATPAERQRAQGFFARVAAG